MDQTEIVRRITLFFKKQPDVEVCLLFGSAAEDRTISENSDIDVAICAKEPIVADRLAELQLCLSEELAREVDLLDISRLNGLILRKVISNGLRVINTTPELLAYHIKRMLYYSEDMYPNYRMMQNAKLRRFAYGH